MRPAVAHWLRIVLVALLSVTGGLAHAVAKREFSPALLARMGGDWERMSRDAFFVKYKMNPRIFARLRKETGAFPNKVRGIQPNEVAVLKEDFFLVVAGLRKESQVLKDHGLTYTVVDTLRTKAEHEGDFPHARGRELGQVPKLPRQALEDWALVRAGELKVAAFRKRYPKIKAGELAAVQDAAKATIDVGSGVKGKVAESVMKLSAAEVETARALSKPTAKIPEALIKKLKQEWGRVERMEISQERLCAEIGIPKHQLMLYKQLHPDEFVLSTGLRAEERERLMTRWEEVTSGKIAMARMLKEEGVSNARFYDHRLEHPEDFPTATRGKFNRASAKGESALSAEQLEGAKALFTQFHRAEISQAQLHERLRQFGISSPAGRDYLRTVDETAFSSREDFLDRNFDAIIDDLIQIAKDRRFVIKRWQDFTDLAEKDPQLRARWGPLRISSQKGFLVARDRRGDRRLHKVLEEIGLGIGHGANARAAAAANRLARERAEAEEQAAPTSQKRSERDAAEQAAGALKGVEPTKENLLELVEQLWPGEPEKEAWRKWLGLRHRFEGVFPELRRWNFDERHKPYSLRYVARWAQSVHDAGPGATHDEIVKIFKKSDEYMEDGRAPSSDREGELGHVVSEMTKHYPELVTSVEQRTRFQKERRLLELLRTAPSSKTLYDLKAELTEIGFPHTGTVYQTLGRLRAAEARRMGVDPKLLLQMQRTKRGLGKAKDPGFDPNVEPPELDLKLAGEILATPKKPPLLELALERLQKRPSGPRPFVSSNVMFINHRYSDLVPFAETMIAAGMAPKNSVFVSTPYPFSSAVDYQLRKLGIETLVPKQSMDSMAEEVERGIEKMLATYDDQAKRWTSPHPILILDDGGMAAKIIASKFKEHFTKFRIVEITAAGERIAQDLARTHGRLPFVYFSIAYSEMKKRITSEFFATRVVDKVLKLVPQTGVALANQRAVVRGGGPMGLFAAKRLRDDHKMDVTIIEPDAKKAAECVKEGFKVEEPEEALPGRGLVLGMSGYEMKPELMKYIDDGAVVAQGSSKRQEFPMDHVEKNSKSKTELPRTDGLPQKSFTYAYKAGGKTKRLHVLGDGWTINHDGSLHGTPIEDIQLELSLVFESAVEAADTHLTDTGRFRIVGADIQETYVDAWKQVKDRE